MYTAICNACGRENTFEDDQYSGECKCGAGFLNMGLAMQYAWKCPKCGVEWAPWLKDDCPQCKGLVGFIRM